MPSSHATLLYDGVVYYVPSCSFHTICHLDFTYYPFDEQNCFIKLGLWAYDSTEVFLSLMDNETEVINKSYPPL